jgi:hypothetical protein
MAFKPSLLAGAALGLVCAVAAGQAQAAPKKHHAKAAADAGLKAEVQQLRDQVEALQATIAAQQAAAQQTQGQIQAAQAQAQQAQATAQAASDQAAATRAAADAEIKTIPATVKTEVTKAVPKPGWEANTQVSGRMYADLSHIEQKRDGASIAPTGTGVDVKRFYVGIDHKFNNVFSGNVTTDFNYSSTTGETQIFIKKAYLQAKLSDALIFRLGSADAPWIPYVEDLYGYRFVEQTIIDRTKYGNSADWGIHALGKYGIFNYQISVLNGNGYKNPTRTNAMDFEGRVGAAYKGFNVAVGGYSGKRGNDVTGAAATIHTADRFDVVGAYVQPRFRVGVEYFWAKNWNNVTSHFADTSDGISIFGNFNITPQISAFGKYEHVNPNKITRDVLHENYFNLGLNYEPVKIVDLALVYKRDAVDNGQLSTGNGTIGGSAIGKNGTYDEFGLFTQLRW